MEFGGPLTVRYADYVPVFPDRTLSAAQKAGLKFERNVVRRLDLLHERVQKGPWFYYQSPAASGICQPDALVWLAPTHILVVEVKLTWVRAAREKLLKFYGPIVQAAHPRAELSYLQVYRNYKKGCHKRTVSLYELESIPCGAYKECHIVL